MQNESNWKKLSKRVKLIEKRIKKFQTAVIFCFIFVVNFQGVPVRVILRDARFE